MPYEHVRPVDLVAMSPTAAAASTGLRPERIQAAVRAGEIRAVRIGCKTRIQAAFQWGLAPHSDHYARDCIARRTTVMRPKYPPER